MTGFATAFHDYQQERRHSTGIRNRKPAQEVRRREKGAKDPNQRRRLGGAGNGASANRR